MKSLRIFLIIILFVLLSPIVVFADDKYIEYSDIMTNGKVSSGASNAHNNEDGEYISYDMDETLNSKYSFIITGTNLNDDETYTYTLISDFKNLKKTFTGKELKQGVVISGEDGNSVMESTLVDKNNQVIRNKSKGMDGPVYFNTTYFKFNDNFDATEFDKLFNYKFTDGKLRNLSFSDIYFSAMKNINKDFSDSIIKSNEVLNITGQVIPVTLDEMNICAELQDGTIITQRSKIAQTVQDKVTKINRVYLNPANCKTAPGVLEAIKEADAIIIGPGSIYTDVIPNLLVKNVAKTIRESKALKIYLSNIMTEPGQTDDYSVSEHINSIVEHCGKGIVNFCISDLGEIVPEYIRKYNLMGSSTVEIDSDKIKGENVQLIKGELASIDGTHIRHDPDKTAQLIIELICTDLRFKDKHNDEQYMLLNSRLKQEKKKAKIANKKAKRIKNNKYDKHDNKSKERRKSKFSDKYQERIQSIKESEKTRLENRKIQEKAQKLIEEEEAKEKERFLKETYSKKTKK